MNIFADSSLTDIQMKVFFVLSIWLEEISKVKQINFYKLLKR
jgi:hypothetical protein